MASSDSLTSVLLQSADVLAGVALSDAARWNQTADDWQLFVSRGHAIGWRTARSELIASAAALPYGADMGWISMVLVDAPWQHRGLAAQMLDACVEHLQSRAVVPVLDATPAGEAVYRRMGFSRGFDLARWQADVQRPSTRSAPVPGLRPADIHDLDTIATLDHAATGLDRRFLLRSFLSRHGTSTWLKHDAQQRPSGFVMSRNGRRAIQVGPLVADGASQALELLHVTLASLRGLVFIDVPSRWNAVTDWLAQQGFSLQRPFVRMALAATLPGRIAEADDRLFAIAGPEFG